MVPACGYPRGSIHRGTANGGEGCAAKTKDMIEQHNLLNKEGILPHTMKEDFGPINAANLRRAHAHQEIGKAIGKSVLIGF